MKLTALTLGALLALSGSGCSEDEDPAAYAKKAAKQTETPRPPSDIRDVSVPVPVGKKVACEDWLKLEPFAAALGQELAVKDKSGSEVEATSVCSIVRAGEPPDAKAQEKMFNEGGMKVGVLPGDEYCLAHLYCSYIAEFEDLEKKCNGPDDTFNVQALGQPACVHRTQRGPDWAYAYKTIDGDTKCSIVVLGGPSVTDEELVQKCTRATLETLTQAGIQNFK